MSLFRLLHRVVKGMLLALLALGLWLLWQNREQGRPVLDLYLAWEDSEYQRPDPLPRSTGTVSRILGENQVEFRDREGRAWTLGLSGLGAVSLDGRNAAQRQFATETRTLLRDQLIGRPLEVAWLETNANRSALGFIYFPARGPNLALEMVESGRLRWLEEGTRRLPLLEQMRLRGADRRARASQTGLWKPDFGGRISEDR